MVGVTNRRARDGGAVAAPERDGVARAAKVAAATLQTVMVMRVRIVKILTEDFAGARNTILGPPLMAENR